MKNIKSNTVRFSSVIIMSYKNQCKHEGAILTRIKTIRAVLSELSQTEATKIWQCNKNTIGVAMSLYKAFSQTQKELIQQSLTTEDLRQFPELEHISRAPHSNSRSLRDSEEENELLR